MDNFIVSARKYRPVTFDTVVGQQSITTTLKNAIRNKQLAQAFLFTGPRGVGKTTCARILAKTINCKNLTPNIEPCNECDSCKAFNTSASFNIHELDAASNNSVEDIRALVDQVRIPPQSVNYKVYIIDEVHMLSAAAFNAFLKTLEEPPAYAKFILATTEKHKILPTILSRCQIFDFNRITVDDIAHHLEFVARSENISAESEALHLIAQKADGGLRDALSIFDQIASFSGSNITYENVLENLNVLDVNEFFEITAHIAEGNINKTLLKLNDIYESGHDAHQFINGLADHLRNLLVSKDPETVVLLETSPAIKDKYRTHAQHWDVMVLLKALDICSKTDVNYKITGNKRLLVELSLLQMCALSGPLAEHMRTQTQTPPAKPQPVVQKPVQKQEPTPVQTTVQTPVQTPVQPPKSATPPPVTPQAVTQPQVQKPVTETKMDVAMGSVNIANIMNNEPKQEASPVTTPETEPEAEAQDPGSDFTEDQLHAAWTAYTAQEGHSPNFRSILNAARPAKENENTITFTVISSFQEAEIKTHYQECVGFLRKELNNSKITLKIAINAEQVQTTVKPFTVKDKYQSMAGKNPGLTELKDKLELDFDY